MAGGVAEPPKSGEAAVVRWRRGGRDDDKDAEDGVDADGDLRGAALLAALVTLPPAWFDALLLRLFPGKPLEELDKVDWPRLMRALQVRELETVEELRALQLAGKYQPTAMEWRRITANDALWRAEGRPNG
jgi:hypothetical protein